MNKKIQWTIFAIATMMPPFLILKYGSGALVGLVLLPVLYLMFFRPVIYFLLVLTVFNNIPYGLQEKTRIHIGSFPVTIPELLLGGAFISCLLFFSLRNRI